MGETRKSDFVGDVFGEWTVVGKADAQGDRKRRWVVQNDAGVQMTVEQVNLKDLALAKKLKDKVAIPVLGQDESNAFENAFTLTEAEADLYRRLDARGAVAGAAMLREAVASTALDGETYVVDSYVQAMAAALIANDNAFEDDGYPGNPDYELATISAGDEDIVLTLNRDELSATTPETLDWVRQAHDEILKAKVALNNAIKHLGL